MPRGVPLTVNNIKEFIKAVENGSKIDDKYVFPDNPMSHSRDLSHAKEAKHKTFVKEVIKRHKDVVVLFYNGHELSPEHRSILKAFDIAARRFRELKIKSVRLAYYDVGKQKIPKGVDLSHTPVILAFPMSNKKAPYPTIDDLSAEGIMKEVQRVAGKQFELPQFPHLNEKEFRNLETMQHTDDL